MLNIARTFYQKWKRKGVYIFCLIFFFINYEWTLDVYCLVPLTNVRTGLGVSLGDISWCNNDKTHLENDNASIERMRTYNVCCPSLPIVGWGDSVLCQYVNNGPLYYYYYVVMKYFLSHHPATTHWNTNIDKVLPTVKP